MVAQPPPAGPKRNASKKRSFEEAQIEPDSNDVAVIDQRHTRNSAAKRARNGHDFMPTDETVRPSSDDPAAAESTAPCVPTPALLYFITLGNLDTSPSTENLTLGLVKLTLKPENWHTGLSGMLQPAACFLVASLLTRQQNLVEDVVASVEMFGISYEELVKAYGLLCEWRQNVIEYVGEFAGNVDGLPGPEMFLAGGEVQEEEEDAQAEYVAEEEAWDTYDEQVEEEDRPEPDR